MRADARTDPVGLRASHDTLHAAFGGIAYGTVARTCAPGRGSPERSHNCGMRNIGTCGRDPLASCHERQALPDLTSRLHLNQRSSQCGYQHDGPRARRTEFGSHCLLPSMLVPVVSGSLFEVQP